jgi:spermidine/putrescine transport system substrate-binding protein
MYSGDVLMLQEHDPNVRYVVPEEGTNIWLDLWSVAASSTHKAAAYRFIDYLNIPEQAAKNALFVHYATPNLAADRLLPASYHQDPVIFPPADVVRRSEHFEMLPPRTLRAWNGVFAEIVN